MNTLAHSDYIALATRAILETIGKASRRGEAIEQALEHQNDERFTQALRSVAQGMDLEFVQMHPDFGLLLRARGRGPFAPTLGWLHRYMAIDTASNKERKDALREEKRLLGGLTLVALLCDLFPSTDSLRLEWDSSMPITPASVLERLHNIADDIQRYHERETGQDPGQFVTLAEVVLRERIPRVSREESNSVSPNRSQEEMVLKWIKLLCDQGLLIEDKGVRDTQWVASNRLKAYVREAGMLPLVDSVLSMQEANRSAPTDIEHDGED